MTREGKAGMPPEFPLPPKQKKPSQSAWIIAAVLGVVAIVFVGCQFGRNDDGQEAVAPVDEAALEPAAASEVAAKAVAAVIAERQDPAVASRWSYRSHRDPMTDRETHTACTTSTNLASQEWPYGSVSADLCVRQAPQTGLDVYMALNGDGQILCRRYDNCSVRVRFSDGQQQSFSAAEAADGSSNMIFILNASRFVAALKGADVTRIQFTLYRAGSPVLEFPTAGLEWPRD